MHSYNFALPIGHRLNDGRYTIKEVLGYGGFGIVYLAERSELRLPVVIKEFFPRDLSTRDGLNLYPVHQESIQGLKIGLEAFVKEAQTLTQFDHPSIVDVNDFFRENLSAYFVMKFQGRETLKSYLQTKGEQKSVLKESEVLTILSEILIGLEVVHQKGMIHRDIKSSNILVARVGNEQKCVLIDFGTARVTLVDALDKNETQGIESIGYTPPEMYYKQGVRGAWSDLYSVGAIIYEIYFNKVPIRSIERIGNDPIPTDVNSNQNIPEKLKPIILKALSIKYEDRYQTCSEFLKDIEKINGNIYNIKRIPVGSLLNSRFVGIGMACLVLLAMLFWGYHSFSTPNTQKYTVKFENNLPNTTAFIRILGAKSMIFQLPATFDFVEGEANADILSQKDGKVYCKKWSQNVSQNMTISNNTLGELDTNHNLAQWSSPLHFSNATNARLSIDNHADLILPANVMVDPLDKTWESVVLVQGNESESLGVLKAIDEQKGERKKLTKLPLARVSMTPHKMARNEPKLESIIPLTDSPVSSETNTLGASNNTPSPTLPEPVAIPVPDSKVNTLAPLAPIRRIDDENH